MVGSWTYITAFPRKNSTRGVEKSMRIPEESKIARDRWPGGRDGFGEYPGLELAYEGIRGDQIHRVTLDVFQFASTVGRDHLIWFLEQG
jgi:hypothetical protein